MLQQMLLAGGAGGMTLLNAIGSAGLTSNLVLCLDAGDAVSYTSGQKWLDRSGNGYDFFLGADGTGTNDPTFNGTAGSLAAYFSLAAGGEYFGYDAANEAWMNNLHKDNAAFTFVSFLYRAANGDDTVVAGTGATGAGGTGASHGIAIGSNSHHLFVTNAGVSVLNKSADTALGAAAYHMVAVSVDEAVGANGGFFYNDGVYNQVGGSDKFDATYSSPSAGAAGSTMRVGANASQTSSINTRYACLSAWTTALTKVQLDALWALMRGRFGI